MKKIIEIFMKRDGLTRDEAKEHLQETLFQINKALCEGDESEHRGYLATPHRFRV